MSKRASSGAREAEGTKLELGAGCKVLESIMSANSEVQTLEDVPKDNISIPSTVQASKSYLPVPPSKNFKPKLGRGQYRRQQRSLVFEKPKKRTSKSVNMAKYFYVENKSKKIKIAFH